MPKKKLPPLLDDLEKQYLSVAISLPSYGRWLFAGAQAFVRQVGWHQLLERYPELYQIKPKRDGDTLEQLIRNVLEEYVAFRVGTFLKAWSAYQFPKKTFSDDAAREHKVMVTAMQFYADEISATYPEFLAPPQGEEELYTLRCTVEYLPGGKNWEVHQPGRYSSVAHAARYYPGKEWTRRQIEALKRHPSFMQLSSSEARELFLIQSILDDHQARLVDDPVRVVPLSLQEQENFQTVIDLLCEETLVSVDSLRKEGTEAAQEEASVEVLYELEIEISGCQSEFCTRQLHISKTQTDLLAWGNEVYAQGIIHTQEDFACALWEVFVPWGRAELDDHTHTFETSYEDDATIQKMVEVLTTTFLSVRAD